MIPQFSLEGVRRTVFGQGSAANLSQEVELLGGGPVLVVVDPNVLAAGVAEPALKSLEAAKLEHKVYNDITREPEPSEADAAAAQGKSLGAKVVVGIGGGSALDLGQGRRRP
jgi:alcohol dehydrogenase class IV